MARRHRGPGAVSVEAAVILFLFFFATAKAQSPSSTSTLTSTDVTEVAPVPALAAIPIALPEYLSSGSNASAPALSHGVPRDSCSGMFAKGLVAGPLSSVIKQGSLWVYPHDDDGDGNPAPPIIAKRSETLESCAAECENEGSAATLSSGVLACQFSFCPPDSTGSSFKTTKTSGSGNNNGSSTKNGKPALLLPGCPDGFGGPLIPPGQCRFSFESISLHRLHVLKVPTPPPDASPTTVVSGEHVRLATKAYLGATVKGYISLGPVMYFTPNADRLDGPPLTDGGGNKTSAVTCSLEGVRQFERSVGDPRCLRNLTGAEGPPDAAKMCDSLPGCNAFSFVPVGGIRVAWRLYNRFQDMPPYRVSSSPTVLFWYGERPSSCVMPFPGILFRKGGGGKNYDARFTSAAAAVAASLASSGEGGGSGGPGGGRVFGIVAGVAVCFSLVATLAFLAIRRRRTRNGGGSGGGGGHGGGGKVGRRLSSWSPFSTPSMQGEIAATNAASEASAAAVAAAFAGAKAGSKWSLFKNSGNSGAGSSTTSASAHRAGDVELGNPRGVRSSSGSSSLSSSSVAAAAAAAAAAPSRAIASKLSCVASLPPDAGAQDGVDDDDRRREWEIPLESVRLLQRPDGSDWLLGEGAYGKVFRGVVDGIQEVAVKIFFPASSSSSASSAASSARALLSSATAAASTARSVDEDVRAEVALLRSLRHPNVINFLGASFLEDGTAVLITELCVRGDLAEAAAADERAALAKKVARAGGGGGGGGGGNKRFTWQPEYLRDGGGGGGGGAAAGAKNAAATGDESGPGGADAAAAAAAAAASSSGASRRRPGTGLNWQIAAGVAKGLAYLHNQRNVVHLDIKPQNILLDSAYVPKIADVGVAKVIKRAAGAGFGFGGRGSSGGSGSGSASSFGQQHLSTLKHTVGTYAYCAPEVFTGRGVGVKADVFSLGVLLWQLCTGDVPRKRQMRALEVPGEAPTAAVRDMIDACLSEKAEERPSAAEIAAFFEGGLAQLDAEAGVPASGVVAAAAAAPSASTTSATVSRPGSSNLASKFEDAGATKTL